MLSLPFVRGLALLSAFLVTSGALGHAQQPIDLTSTQICERCELVPHLLVRFGDVDGAGIIESQAVQVRYDPSARLYATFTIGGTHILLFDTAGTFVRRIGRAGPGPGELVGIVDAQIRDAKLLVLDRDGPSLMAMTLHGAVEREQRLQMRRGRFRIVSDSTIVLAAMDRTPAAVGYPLHIIDLRSGEPIKRFGSKDGQYSVLERHAANPLLGFSPSSTTFWEGTTVPFLLEEWDLEGRLRRAVVSRSDWFPQEVGGDRSGRPPTRLETFGVDSHDRLWTVTLIPDQTWREAPRQGSEGFVNEQDLSRLFDARIDVYDLRSRRHLGTLKWDEAFVGLVQLGDEFAVQKVDPNTAKVLLYHLDPGRSR